MNCSFSSACSFYHLCRNGDDTERTIVSTGVEVKIKIGNS